SVAPTAATTLLWLYARALQSIAARSSFDLLHFSLHPLEIVRLCMAFGLLLLHAALIWTAAAVMRAPAIFWRTPRSPAVVLMRVGATSGGIVTALLIGRRLQSAFPVATLL